MAFRIKRDAVFIAHAPSARSRPLPAKQSDEQTKAHLLRLGYCLRRRDQRQLNITLLTWSVVNPLHRFLVIGGLGPKDVRYKCLRIAIVEREPARLYLHHDAVTGEEDVVCRRQSELIKQRLIGRDRFGVGQALAIAAAKDIGGNHQLIPAQFRIGCDFIGINIDHLHDPVRVGAAG
jgi:hypothetical protein